MNEKPKWEKPKCMAIARHQSEERILASCKTAAASGLLTVSFYVLTPAAPNANPQQVHDI
jgi:hypothetical protein